MNSTTDSRTPIHNHILAALPAAEYERLLPSLEHVALPVALPLGEVLYEPHELLQHIYFPDRGIISLTSMMENGAEVEVGVIGNEGMFGLPVALGTNSMPLRAMVQIPGSALRMKAAVLKEEIKECRPLYRLLLRYSQALFIQSAQSAACNRLHSLDERLVRWLLMCHDRVMSDHLQLTHEFLAIMLGSRRAGVSEAASNLQANGIISYTLGLIQVLDREGLEAAACECYQIVKEEFVRLHNKSSERAFSSKLRSYEEAADGRVVAANYPAPQGR